jgi:precorrin-2 methylase
VAALPRLYVIGLGIKIPDHTTVEALRIMSKCTRIYSIVQEPPSRWLPSGMAATLPVVNVLEMYAEGAVRTQNYDRVASTIFEAMTDTETVGYVTYGNPLAYDSVAQNLIRQAQASGIRFEVVAGISSIDTLLCDLGRDMAPGIQIYEASWLVASRIQLDVAAAAILLQLGTFGSFRTHYRDWRQATSLEDLRTYLTESYPLSHKVFLVQSSNQLQPARIVEVTLDKLCHVAAEDFMGASMYLPALETGNLDENAVKRMLRS